ncbi:MAG TPA: hypothetical protein VMY77_09890 [Chitinophagaceae bacterium]|nr:hypothetical protein [Chitinophagaceae bacterium]
MFLFTAGNSFGQVSHANISATVTTPVGAELSGDINGEKLADNNLITTYSVTAKDLKKAINLTFLKIIGEEFSHNTTVEKDQIILKRKENEEAQILSNAMQRVVRITVNFD